MIRGAVAVWMAVCVIVGGWVLRDAEREVHGRVAPDLCTDCAQFAAWMAQHP